MTLRGAGIVMTGGSKGLGRALAFELARRKARLFLTARGKDDLDRVVRAVRAQGGDAHGWPADIADKEAVYPFAGAAHATLGRVDVLIHNASALGPSPLRPLLDTDCEDLERALAVNLIGPFRLSKALLGPMAMSGRGLLVHVTSDASVSAYPSWGAYAASKAALDHLGRVWAAELDPLGVRVVNVDPGDMNTELHREAAPGDDPSTLLDPHEVAERFADLLESVETLPNGARVALSEWRPPRKDHVLATMSEGSER
ncbi:MAG TPA: SDR family oxidoreductase [Candidatus Eisenbacteria bacterium]|nr:SDR family oxidoreductase [Candidatus Eisenbacteria bacterium]